MNSVLVQRSWLVVLACGLLIARGGRAGEPYLEFLRALQLKGYGEQALAYLDQIADQPDLPADLKRDLVLERSKSLKIAATEAYDAPQRDSRLAEAKKLSEQFFKDHPDHAEAASTLLDEGKAAQFRGQISLAKMRAARSADEQKEHRTAARTTLTEARKLFADAEKTLKARLDALPADRPVRGRNNPRELLDWAWLEARFYGAQCVLFAAQAIENAKDKERVQMLKEAGDALDKLFQEYRGKPLGSLAHLWHGLVYEEQGNTTTALDVYDEVLVLAPEGKDADLDLAPLFGQAALFRLKLIAKTAEPKKVLAEGEEWLLTNKRWQSTGPYQGMHLETTRARLKLVESARTAAEKTKLTRDAIAALTAIGKVDSEYRHEATMMRRGIVENTTASANMTLAERIAVGDEAAASGNWSSAETMYREAITQATTARDNKQVTAVKGKLAQVLYQRVLKHYSAGEMDQCLALAGEIVRDNSDQPIAESTSAVAVAAALQVYSTVVADGKAAALARLEKVATYAISRWPDNPVGDDARMALAQARLIQGDFAGVEQQVAAVTPQSKRYPTALQILGQIRWRQYVDIKKSEDPARAEEGKKHRAEAVSALQTSVQRQRAAWQAGTEPMPEPLFDTQLLLAEIMLEGQQFKDSAELFAPLMKALAEKPPGAIDQKTQRAYVGAVRALLAVGDAAQAGEAATAFASISGDSAQPNSLLVDLSKLFAIELRKLEAESETGVSGTPMNTAPPPAIGNPPPSAPPADPHVAALRDSLGKQIDAIYGRNLLSVPQLIYVGDTSVLLGKNEQARTVYQRLLDTIDKDESAKATAGAATTRIRSRIIGLLRSEGKLVEANKQVDALIKAHPTALEPQLEKGYILESLAAAKPAMYDECIAHWTQLRVQLGRAKTRLPEYYEVLYNAARCLVRQARATNNKEKALQAEQMLKSTLTLSPKLSGPDMVAKYEALLKAAVILRGAPTAAASSEPRRAAVP